jgi:NADPH-dependent glutamate synthase beta subunit-like oxidoreductase
MSDTAGFFEIRFESIGGLGAHERRRAYAGGDAVTAAATVILAAGAGKSAAEAIHRDLAGAI